MCGRYNFSTDSTDEKLAAIISVMERRYPGEFKTGEIFPGDTAPAVIARDGKIVPVPAVFGFQGFRDGKLIINARGETAAEKKMFSESLKERRIILPATGFYEWDTSRTKYLFTADARPVLYLCGLYAVEDGRYRFVILTRAANESMKETHDRMPVIADESEVRAYLTDPAAAAGIIAAASPVLHRQEDE
ncbi:MAG: SOS response-associated peptidase family protein [Oscillospiraceae bacterium]|nr:SOS response-associated peptidase family protein [Oscillospiraceae bacterium]